jgi:hypothetical protein
MPLRFKQTGLVVPIAGTSIPHGLTKNGVAATPDEYWIAYRAAPALGLVFFSATPVDNTNLNLSAVSTGTVDVFAAINHTYVA